MKLTSPSHPADPLVILSIDFANAFNSIRRYPIAAAIESSAPQISAFFHWAYETSSSPLLLSNGSQIASSSTGVRQGDPLGPLFFCLGVQASLAKIHSALPSVSPLYAILMIPILSAPSPMLSPHLRNFQEIVSSR
jgi:hypothetical protein